MGRIITSPIRRGWSSPHYRCRETLYRANKNLFIVNKVTAECGKDGRYSRQEGVGEESSTSPLHDTHRLEPSQLGELLHLLLPTSRLLLCYPLNLLSSPCLPLLDHTRGIDDPHHSIEEDRVIWSGRERPLKDPGRPGPSLLPIRPSMDIHVDGCDDGGIGAEARPPGFAVGSAYIQVLGIRSAPMLDGSQWSCLSDSANIPCD
jgi:hypothetical protein